MKNLTTEQRNIFIKKNKQSNYMKMPDKSGNYVLRWYNQSVTKPVKEKKITINSNE